MQYFNHALCGEIQTLKHVVRTRVTAYAVDQHYLIMLSHAESSTAVDAVRAVLASGEPVQLTGKDAEGRTLISKQVILPPFEDDKASEVITTRLPNNRKYHQIIQSSLMFRENEKWTYTYIMTD